MSDLEVIVPAEIVYDTDVLAEREALEITNPAPHCNPTSAPASSVLGRQRTVTVLGGQRMLTFTEHTMRGVCVYLDVELAEFNGEADHVHLLVAYSPTLAISVLSQRLKGRAAAVITRRLHVHRCVPAQPFPLG
jgi:hypothetical protein